MLAHGSESHESPNSPADILHVPRLLLRLQAHCVALMRGRGNGGEPDAMEAPLSQGDGDETNPGY